MNPLRGLAWRTRTFLSEPVHDVDRRAAERAQEATDRDRDAIDREEALAGDIRNRLDSLSTLLREAREDTERATAENRRLVVALRTQLDEQGVELASVHGQLERLLQLQS